MQLVLKHHLGGVQHAPKQTAETTGLVWIKGVKLDIMSEPQLSINGEQWEGVGEEGQEYLKNLIQTLRDKHKEDLLDPIKWEESRKRYLERKMGSKLKFDLLGDLPEPFEPFNDENLQYTNEVLQQAWDNVKERHKDILQRMSDN
jgi:predicted small metal-binding protein